MERNHSSSNYLERIDDPRTEPTPPTTPRDPSLLSASAKVERPRRRHFDVDTSRVDELREREECRCIDLRLEAHA